MKIYIILLIYFSIIFSAFSNEIDNKGLVCEYSIDSNKPNEYYWFSDGQVYKVWYDKKTKIIKKSTYPAYYKLTEEYIRFYRIFVFLNTLDFTDKNKNIIGSCIFVKDYKNVEELIQSSLN